jgi:hypothetical protein
VLAKTDLNENLLHKAAFSGKANTLEYLVQKGCTGVNEADGLGNTPLAVAAQGTPALSSLSLSLFLWPLGVAAQTSFCVWRCARRGPH